MWFGFKDLTDAIGFSFKSKFHFFFPFFNEKFAMYAHQIEETSEFNVRSVYSTLSTFGTTVTSFSLYSHTSWPNITLPHFPRRAKHFTETTKAEYILLCPVVTTDENFEWEQYAEMNHQWMKNMLSSDCEEDEVDEIVRTSITTNKPRNEIIAVHKWISDSTGIPFDKIEDIYQVPAWQMYPMVCFILLCPDCLC